MLKNVMLLLILLMSIYFVSCTQGTSSPQYNYKKPAGDGVVLKMGEITILEKDMVKGIENDLYEAEEKIFDLKMSKAKAMLLEQLVNKDPRKKDLTTDQFLDKYIAAGIKVEQKEIDSFIKEKAIPAEHINDQIKERIQSYLMMEKKKVAIETWFGEQSKKTAIEVFLEKPSRPTFNIDVAKAPFAGKENAKVTLVEYSDFQCPFCAKGAETVKQLKDKYKDKIKVVFKNFPLPFHNQAKQASMAAMCANEQSTDLFWKMHDKLFADQSKLDSVSLKATAKTLGADEKKFNECYDSNKYLEYVENDIKQGTDLGIKSTPTFFVNGQLIAGALPIEEFSKIIDEQLSK
jgi:protein-disulfide isomerase